MKVEHPIVIVAEHIVRKFGAQPKTRIRLENMSLKVEHPIVSVVAGHTRVWFVGGFPSRSYHTLYMSINSRPLHPRNLALSHDHCVL